MKSLIPNIPDDRIHHISVSITKGSGYVEVSLATPNANQTKALTTLQAKRVYGMIIDMLKQEGLFDEPK
jgi:hypothetical protein